MLVKMEMNKTYTINNFGEIAKFVVQSKRKLSRKKEDGELKYF